MNDRFRRKGIIYNFIIVYGWYWKLGFILINF
jgi:hypothetical protein